MAVLEEECFKEGEKRELTYPAGYVNLFLVNFKSVHFVETSILVLSAGEANFSSSLAASVVSICVRHLAALAHDVFQLGPTEQSKVRREDAQGLNMALL